MGVIVQMEGILLSNVTVTFCATAYTTEICLRNIYSEIQGLIDRCLFNLGKAKTELKVLYIGSFGERCKTRTCDPLRVKQAG